MLVAGVGNIFLGDDGFGVEVVRRLAAQSLPADVEVHDFGIRGLHLAYQMLDGGYGTTVLVDATPRGGTPGSLYLIEPELDPAGKSPPDAHSMDPAAVLAAVKALGGTAGRVLIVGCEPASLEERIGLSAAVENVVDDAVKFLREVIERERARGD